MRKLTLIVTVLAVPGATLTATALANEGAARSIGLEEIVITAQRREQSAQDVPISISAFSGEQLEKLGVTQTRDIAAHTPGFQWKGGYKFAAPTIFLRGIGDNSFNANNVSAVGMYFDDVYIASGAALNQASLDLDRVEVLKGPQGTLYGRNTSGGAVNFIPRKPVVGDPFKARGSLSAAEYGAWEAEAAVQMPVGERAALRVAGAWQTEDGPYDLTETGGKGPDVEASAARALLSIAATDSVNVLLGVHTSESAADAIQKFAGAVDPLTFGPCADPKIGGDCIDYAGFSGSSDYLEDHAGTRSREKKVSSTGASARIDWDSELVVLTSITAWEEDDRDHTEDLDHAPTDWIKNEWQTEASQFSQELRIRSADSESGLRWIAGAYYSNEDLESFQSFALRGFGPGLLTGGLTLEGVGQAFTQDTESAALFGEVYYDLAEDWTVTLGLRQTWEEKDIALDGWIFDADGTSPEMRVLEADARDRLIFPTVVQRDRPDWSEWSGKIALEYHPTDFALVYGSVSRGFKAGGFNGGALLDQAGATVVDPEFLTAWELGFKSELLDGRMRLNAAAFYYDFTDQQVFVLQSDGVALVQTLTNAGTSSVLGAEFDWQYALTDSWLLGLGGAWLDAEFDEFRSGGVDYAGNELVAAPGFSGNALIRYTWTLSGNGTISFQGDASYTDDQYFEATNNPVLSASSYTLCNARVTYASGSGKYEFALWGRNLTDEEYLVDGFDNATFGWYAFVPGNPRSFGVTVSMVIE